MLAIFAALETEIREFKKGMVITQTSSYQDCRICEGQLAGKDLLLVLTGMGERRAKAAAQYVLDKYPVSVLVSSGFAGSLNEKTAVGDILIYMMLRCEQRRSVSAGKPLQPNSTLLAECNKAGQECGIPVLTGRGVSISRVCATPKEKSKLGRDSGADGVDMESFWIGQIAAARNVPFITVRVISDSAEDDLSLLAHVTAGGRVKPLKALSYFVRHPGQVKRALGLAANSRKSGRNLAIYLNRLVKDV